MSSGKAINIPARNENYVGPITNTHRWDNFQHRADDIFICTPPKCGTTWTQAICAMLVFGKADHGMQPGLISPWIDAAFAPIEDYLIQVDEQRHRRFIKTHSPLNGIPYFPECTYLAIFRDPRDCYISGSNHRNNMTDKELADVVFPSGNNAYNDWLYAVREPGTWDLQSVDCLGHFFKTYWAYRHLPNIHLFHYSDMKKELKQAISSMAKALDLSYDDVQLDEFTRAASFENMKKSATQFAPESGTGMWKAEKNFFANGVSNQWQDKLSLEEQRQFIDRIHELLPTEDANWMMNGDSKE
jgi:aryl sulfotransferase